MQRIVFDWKEQRHVKLEVKSTNSAPFRIIYAKYRLLYCNETEAEGECEINEHILDMFINPKKSVTYILEVEYGIADEVYVDKIELVVR